MSWSACVMPYSASMSSQVSTQLAQVSGMPTEAISPSSCAWATRSSRLIEL